jgi:hypothetical protein
MHPVSFITTEDDRADLVVSFAIQEPSDPEEVESLTLQRAPKYEPLKDEEERGVTVSFIDRFPEDDDMGDRLQEVRYSASEEIVELATARRRYRLDVRRVDPEEIADMRKVLRKMNFDGRFRAVGL